MNGDARPSLVQAAALFEVAWEVCNQVGGIYQVLRSKAPTMVERWRDRYFLVGPWIESKAALEFEAARPSGWLARALEALASEGLRVRYGRWLIPGNPRVLLVEHWQGTPHLDAVKHRLWTDHRIESPPGDYFIDASIAFGDAVRRLLEKVHWFFCGGGAESPPVAGEAAGARRLPSKPADRRMLAHFHEWVGGAALPMLRHQRLPVATTFTTHATLLGRYMASGEDNFYDRLPWVNDAEMAAKFNIAAQHGIERACAHSAHVFTTVSAITGEECSQLLGRAPDIIVPNGLNIGRYYAAHEMQVFHAQYKDRIHLFTMGHFFPSYSFDLDRTLYFFTSGRYEPRNKGFDLCLEACARLNAQLKAANLGITVVFFIITARQSKSLNPRVLEKRGVLNELREVCQKVTDSLGERLFREGAAGERIHLDDQIEEYWRLRYKRTQFALRTSDLPYVTTHMFDDDSKDPVLNQIRNLGLFNRADDPVKIVYHPEFISPVSPLWGIEYEQFVRGCHLGVFPSAYEPWGYTPLECMALGVPAISSDLAGFGRYVAEHFIGHEELGVGVLRRRGRSYPDAAADLAASMFRQCELRRRDRIALRNAVERFSWEFDWSRLGNAYHRAHDLAIERLDAQSRAPVQAASEPAADHPAAP